MKMIFNRRKNFVIQVFVCCLTLAVFSLAVNAEAPKKRTALSCGTEQLIDAEGIKIKGFFGAKPIPLQPPRVVNLSESGSGKKYEAFFVNELWTAAQFIGRWVCDSGELSIYKLSLRPPSDGFEIILGKYVFKSVFEDWKRAESSKFKKEDLQNWLGYFSPDSAGKSPETLKSPQNIALMRCKLADLEGKYRESYLAYDKSRPEDIYLFEYDIDVNSDLKRGQAAIQQSIATLSFYTPKNARIPVNAGQLKQRTSKDYSEEYKQNLEQTLTNIRNLRDWWYIETENYIIASNLKEKRMVTEIEKNIEKIRAVYKDFFPLQEPLKNISVVKVFKTHEDYVSYLGRDSDLKWSCGMWVPAMKELIVSGSGPSGHESLKDTLSVLYHEGFHQYMFYACGGKTSSAWFNEGTAQFFEGCRLSGGTKDYDIEISQKKEALLDPSRKRNINVKKLLDMDYEEFYDKNSREENYINALCLMYFLYKGAPAIKNKPQYAEIPLKYYKAFYESGNAAEATRKAWEGIDMDAFEKDLAGFWSSPQSLNRAKSYNFSNLKEKAH